MLKLNSLSGFGSGVSGAASVTPVNGYWAGGRSSAKTKTTDKLVFATETTAVSTDSELDVILVPQAGISDPTGANGYISGGNTGANTVKTEKLDYSTSVMATNTDADLPSAMANGGGVSEGVTKGYSLGGND